MYIYLFIKVYFLSKSINMQISSVIIISSYNLKSKIRTTSLYFQSIKIKPITWDL